MCAPVPHAPQILIFNRYCLVSCPSTAGRPFFPPLSSSQLDSRPETRSLLRKWLHREYGALFVALYLLFLLLVCVLICVLLPFFQSHRDAITPVNVNKKRGHDVY